MHDEDQSSPIGQDSVKVRCNECQTVVLVPLETEEVDRTEREMGPEVTYETTGEASCDCGNEITYIETNWEYPEGTHNHTEGPEISGGTSA